MKDHSRAAVEVVARREGASVTQPKFGKLGWWEFNNPKYWEFYRWKRAINWRQLETSVQRSIRAAHMPWWERVMWSFGWARRLRSHDELLKVLGSRRQP